MTTDTRTKRIDKHMQLFMHAEVVIRSYNFADLQSASLKYVLLDPRRIVPPI